MSEITENDIKNVKNVFDDDKSYKYNTPEIKVYDNKWKYYKNIKENIIIYDYTTSFMHNDEKLLSRVQTNEQTNCDGCKNMLTENMVSYYNSYIELELIYCDWECLSKDMNVPEKIREYIENMITEL